MIELSLLVIFPIIIVYLLNFFILYSKSLQQFGKIWEKTLYISLFCVLIVISYSLWFLRLFFLPIDPFSQWIWFWKLKILFLFSAVILIGFFGLSFHNNSNLKKLFFIGLIPIILYIIELISLDDPNKVQISAISTITYVEFNLLLVLTFIVLIIYLLLPIKLFFTFMRLSPKENESFAKSKLLVIGLLAILSSVSLNMLSILLVNIEYLPIIADLFLLAGGSIIIVAFTKYQSSSLIED